jgi:hypothetical protein
MTESTPLIPARDAGLTDTVVRFKRTFEADITAIKRDLAQWLDAHPSNSTATPIALLETALDCYLAGRTSETSDLTTAAADATDMVQAVLRRAVQRRRLALHLKASRRPRASAIPITDEELANRLTEMLNLLDLVAEPLPQDAALRQFIDDAADPLGTLLGYFVGNLNTPAASRKTLRRNADRTPPAPARDVPSPAPDLEPSRPPPTPYEVEEW